LSDSVEADPLVCPIYASSLKTIWISDGLPVRMFGVPLRTRMIIVKLSDDSLQGQSWLEVLGSDSSRLNELLAAVVFN